MIQMKNTKRTFICAAPIIVTKRKQEEKRKGHNQERSLYWHSGNVFYYNARGPRF